MYPNPKRGTETDLLTILVVTFFAGTGALPTSVSPMHTKSGTFVNFATSVVLIYTGTGLLPTSVLPVNSKSGALLTSVVPIFTGSGKIFGNFRCTCLGFNTFLSTSLVLVLTKSALHQRFGCWSGLHWNLTELAEILGENLKESDLSQMCT